ncbi:D-aminoacylase [Candidatus Bathyarchaeota archaeon]|nr:D-aminoacylase [Candidatus Bathyarchaeota archaeon]
MYDVIIKKGKIIDGTGNPWFKADVAINEGRVVQIKKNINEKADKIIEARGLIVSPGFIDMHNHTDLTLPIHKYATSSLMMGLTTEAVGNCGHLPAPITEKNLEHQRRQVAHFSYVDVDQVSIEWETIPEYYEWLTKQGIGVNVVPFFGHGSLRRAIMGKEGFGGERRIPEESEMREMLRIVEDAMIWGAKGMTTGLSYEPGRNSYTEEIIELCKVVAKYDGVYMSHLRFGGDMLIDATKEHIEIAEETGVTAVASHYKARTGGKGPLPKELFKIIDEARNRGVEVILDTYPWDKSQAGNMASPLVPPDEDWSVDQLMEKLKDPEQRKKIEDGTIERAKKSAELGVELRRRSRLKGIPDKPKEENPPIVIGSGVIVYSLRHPEYLGKTLNEVAQIKGVEPIKALIDLVLEDEGCTRVAGTMEEEDLQEIMKYNLTSISTDAWTLDWFPSLRMPSGLLPHPRNYGTYPRVLGHYARDLKLFSLEDAVKKMTSLPAQGLKLRDRGLLREGNWADMVVFNAETINQGATYSQYRYPEGVNYVLVNGQIVVEEGKRNKTLVGKLLKNR